MQPRPLVLILLDGWSTFGPRPWDERPDRTPHLALLARHGQHGVAVTTFPGVTPTALATLATGHWPDRHGIPGILWYHRGEDRHVHYWPSWEQARAGLMGRVARDILMDLNDRHLDPGVRTLFEQLEDLGVRCAVANLPIRRGPIAHVGRLRFPLDPLLYRGPMTISGPTDLTTPGFRNRTMPRLGRAGEGFAVGTAAGWMRDGRHGLVVVYLPATDMASHRQGPPPSIAHWERLDRQLGRLMRAAGGPERALARWRWLIVGDHGQSRVCGGKQALAPDRIFRDLDPVPFGRGGFGTRHPVALAPNDRALLAWHAPTAAGRRAAEILWERLGSMAGIEVLARRQADGSMQVRDVTGGRMLTVRPGGPHRDPWGHAWHLSGDPAALDLHGEGRNLTEGRYPAALMRLWTGTAHADMAASATPGWEFTTGTPLGLGNHGSLHACDSWTPVLALGMSLPSRLTLADLGRQLVTACTP